ncbi:MAG: ABC transporter substrate binding protein [Desulfurivibrionaceae bacterium]|jgi:ABC-type uncharacterized transport system substrate-binding protein
MHANRFFALLLKAALLLLTMNLLIPQAVFAARCLYVSSYHAGYVWNDDIEDAMEKVLQGQCEIKKFYMDGKRNLAPEFAQQKALEAKKIVEAWKPDVVIAADDNASRYLVLPYFKNTAVPVVFCGINWTVEPYGYPYSNTTGMVEIGPVEPLAKEVRKVVPNAKQGVFLSADEMTQDKEFALNKKVYAKHGITVTHRSVKTMADWEKAFLVSQKADFVILGNNAGIKDWSHERALAQTMTKAKKFTVSYLDWMAPYTMLTMAKIAGEQGDWAARAALRILKGARPNSIPIAANQRWNIFVNPAFLKETGFTLPADIKEKAVQVGP